MIGIRFCPVSAARARGIVAGRAKLIQQSLSEAIGAIPLIGIFIPFLIYFYALVVQARLTGTLFLRYQNRIGW